MTEERTATTAGAANTGGERLWGVLHYLLLAKFRKGDTKQHRIAVPFLRTLVKDKGFWTDAEAIERSIYQYKEISAALVDEGELTKIDQVIWFLQGLPDRIGEQIYTIAVGYSHSPCSFHYVYVDSILFCVAARYGQPHTY